MTGCRTEEKRDDIDGYGIYRGGSVPRGTATKTVDELLDDYGMFIRVKDTKLFDDEIVAIRHEIKERAHEAPGRI